MKRALVVHETFDCHECGAPIKALEEFDWCGKCEEPIHIGAECSEFLGSQYFCPECAEKVKKEIDRENP